MNEAIVRAVRSVTHSIDSANNALKVLLKAADDELINKVLDAIPNPEIRASYWDDSEIVIASYFYDLDGFKDAQLMIPLERLLDMVEWKQETRDTASHLRRDYTLKHGDLIVNLVAYAKEDNPTCRKVKVGEEVKTVVEEKFEIVCE